MICQAKDQTYAGSVDLAQAVRTGRIKALDVLENRLAEIERINPGLNCFTRILADRARREAAAVDRQVAAGQDPGPLAGVPFGVKDNYDVAGLVTTAGSIINASLPAASSDAILIQRLSKAGAVLVGAQNMDEYAYGFTTENSHYGPTRNPLDPMRSAGGSSGGSAASVASGLCDFSLGTDTNGSIRVPASFCGIYGLKPTYGRLPRTGTFPFVHELDCLGLFARNVPDLALVYDLVQGFDGGDHACSDRPPALTRFSLSDPVSANVAILDGWFSDRASPQGRAAVAAVAEGLGAQKTVSVTDAHKARAAAFVLTSASGGNLHFDSLRTRAADFDPATRDRLLAGALLPANIIMQAQRFRSLFHAQIMEIFRHHDLLIAPATPCSAPLLGQPTIEIAGQQVPTRANVGQLTQPLSFVGLPVVSVPVFNDDLPIGVQIVAPPWREDLALTAAAHLERRSVVGLKGAHHADQ